MQKIPVILDTDIGDDIDDSWALGMLLKSPELDLKLVTTANLNPIYRGKLVAKFLEISGRSDVPVGLGLPGIFQREAQKEWVEEYELSSYPGKVFEDGVGAMIECIEKSPLPLTLICIAPSMNIAEALRRKPEIASKVNFIGMFGSINKTHDGKPGRTAEFNVVQDIASAQTVFAAPWKSITITPLDTCGMVRLKDAHYEKIKSSKDLFITALLRNFKLWSVFNGSKKEPEMSSILYDTVAVYLAYSRNFIKVASMKLGVDDKGFTCEIPGARSIDTAIDWLDYEAYLDYLTDVMLRPLSGLKH